MRLTLRILLLLAVFAGVAWMTARGVMDHVASGGAMQPEVRLAGATAGLFAGGVATVIAGIAMILLRDKSAIDSRRDKS
jgi:hypothetical protein